MNLGYRIKEQRIACNYTIEELASAVGCTKKTIGRYEKNEYLPRIDILRELIQILNLDANEILNMQNSKNINKRIINITSTNERRISGVLTIRIIQDMLKGKRTLIIEDPIYNDIIDYYIDKKTQYSKINRFSINENEIKELNKYIMKSNDPNVDIILLDSFHSNPDLIYDVYNIREIRNNFKEILFAFQEYDYIFINTITHTKRFSEFWGRVSDLLININNNEETIDLLDFLRDDVNIKDIPMPKNLNYVHRHIDLRTEELNKFLELTVKELREIILD